MVSELQYASVSGICSMRQHVAYVWVSIRMQASQCLTQCVMPLTAEPAAGMLEPYSKTFAEIYLDFFVHEASIFSSMKQHLGC